MKTLWTLVKREYWEQYSLFFKVPLALAVIFTLAAFCVMVLSLFVHGSSHMSVTWQAEMLSPRSTQNYYFLSSMPFVIVLWLTIFYYFTSTLYDDRRDRSVLFWQSMPVSQSQTILSKVLAGVIVAPLCAWVALVLTQLILTIFASVMLVVHPVQPWTALWNIPMMLEMWFGSLVVMIIQALWLLPLLAWCMLWSAYAKKMPALSAVVSLVVIVVIEAILLPRHYIGAFITDRFSYAMQTWNVIHLQSGHHYVLSDFGWNMLLGLVVSLILASAAGKLRSSCYDFDK
ncbi:MAG: ABC transporter permease [Coxiellaceae bacterium]|nr:ABC transporter permease [Coxiellaceae bacterium]